MPSRLAQIHTIKDRGEHLHSQTGLLNCIHCGTDLALEALLLASVSMGHVSKPLLQGIQREYEHVFRQRRGID
jgi:hypothetical protein